MIIYFEIQNSEFEFTFFHAQRNLSYQVLLLLVRSGMSLFMAVEETGSLMRVDIQSAADDVLEKWILCGDPDQIERVGCGSVFRDLLNSNTFCTVTLNQFMRQDAQSSIVQNCKKILEGNPDLIADEQFFIGRYESDEAAKRALLYYYPKDEDCMKHQILSTTKQGKVGTEVLNRTLEGPADADSLIYHDYVYRAGDKVVFVSNNYKAGYCNGDVGVITEIHNGMTVSLGDETVSLGEYDLDEILPADVITVHM